ncbi:MAG TPA: TetR/AcrR family transcriptional regulator [Labilithrix sp.]|nr:TetR/AcrR family transcriptional regulator [Labilithrix sp.]
MPSKKTKTPRKRPQQARAQETVHAILEATVQLLERAGPDAATTTRIAEVAGVSVGTLYQYFSHRDAIFDALQEREFERAIALMQTVLSDDNLAKSPRETVSGCVQGMLALYRASPGMHRVLTMEGLRSGKADRLHSFDLRVISLVRHFLAATGAPVRRKNVDAAAFIAFQCARATMLASLLETPAGVNDQALVEELVDLLLRYLVDDEWLSEHDGATAARPKAKGKSPASATKTRQKNV